MGCRTRSWLFVVGCAACACGDYARPFQQQSAWLKPPSDRSKLAVLEFSERGNLFDRSKLADLLGYARTQQDTLAVVFVHGWKHNARDDDTNLDSFRNMLTTMSGLRWSEGGPKNVVGVYLGWPARSLSLWPLDEFTYWSRKAVAAEVAKGGVTEVLLRLERELLRRGANNMLIVVGHSFGGAVVLGALNEIFLDRLVSATPIAENLPTRSDSPRSDKGCIRKGPEDLCTEGECSRSDRFANGVVLLNPAIEANQILQLKELIAERCFPRDQAKLLHVISTSADRATHFYFWLAQSVAEWAQPYASLTRRYRGEPATVSEWDLLTTAVGNFGPFWTGRLFWDSGRYKYCSFALNNGRSCEGEGPEYEPPAGLIPTRTFEPVSFVYTDEHFMSDHNDVFNNYVIAYLLTIAMEDLERRRPTEQRQCERLSDIHCTIVRKDCCLGFGGCFEHVQARLQASFPIGPLGAAERGHREPPACRPEGTAAGRSRGSRPVSMH